MFLKEFEGSSLFVKYGIPVPAGQLFDTKILKDSQELEKAASQFVEEQAKIGSGEFAVKAQLTKGGRGKSGAIVFAGKEDLVKNITGLKEKFDAGDGALEILVQEKADIEKELYLAMLIDRDKKCPKLVYSERGGVDIERTAETDPLQIFELDIEGFKAGEREKLMLEFFTENGGKLASELFGVAKKLLELFEKEDAVLAEINPLVMTRKGGLIALDSKVIIDDSAISRHEYLAGMRRRGLSATESEAMESGLSYVELDGDIAIIGNGAGLVMATLDSLARKGGKPANFCDVGGGATDEMMKRALKIVLSKKNIKGLFINIFGGITRCDEIANGIVNFFGGGAAAGGGAEAINIPVVIRLTGTNEDAAREILQKYFASSEKKTEVFSLFNDAVSAAAVLSKKHVDSD